MFKKILLGTVFSVGLISPTWVQAVDAPNSSKTSVVEGELKALTAKLTDVLGDITSIKPSPMVGLVEVIADHRVFYSSLDGNFLVDGKLYDINARNDITEETLKKVRLEGVKSFAGDMIVYKAKNEKHVINVFTDITCGYCRKMHEQMDDYNDKGITVRYLAYPRYGVRDQMGQYSQGFKDLQSIWCHEDPQSALTKAKQGSPVAQRICDKPVEAEFDFGRKIGVNGTPAIILENGLMVPGYKDPNSLINILDQIKATS
ncbi:bifunctional protein-disulfide isomerase/oxidoreductase DsbC [Thalassotalea profundi]|uniref:Thiol:disulfide interchange protein n=1 Tax=Thalassotalea profundi TaxID=2036687 RepID=A0ABQ3IMP7_9GAMM|nr:bifunctional protein-disulfide isomerase/oxidoreductase DsbC [Thalassotalea profundi]GHE87000.1 thiol:disulfide interchange protein DsbC [Thalassotalea profundi]